MSGRYGYRLISRTTPPKSPWGNGRHAHLDEVCRDV